MRLILTRKCSVHFPEVSSLLVANKGNFSKYECNNEVSSHKEILCVFC